MVFRVEWEIFAKLQLLKLLKLLRTLVQSVILKTEKFFFKKTLLLFFNNQFESSFENSEYSSLFSLCK